MYVSTCSQSIISLGLDCDPNDFIYNGNNSKLTVCMLTNTVHVISAGKISIL